jgi:hypothetical protein
LPIGKYGLNQNHLGTIGGIPNPSGKATILAPLEGLARFQHSKKPSTLSFCRSTDNGLDEHLFDFITHIDSTLNLIFNAQELLNRYSMMVDFPI